MSRQGKRTRLLITSLLLISGLLFLINRNKLNNDIDNYIPQFGKDSKDKVMKDVGQEILQQQRLAKKPNKNTGSMRQQNAGEVGPKDFKIGVTGKNKGDVKDKGDVKNKVTVGVAKPGNNTVEEDMKPKLERLKENPSGKITEEGTGDEEDEEEDEVIPSKLKGIDSANEDHDDEFDLFDIDAIGEDDKPNKYNPENPHGFLGDIEKISSGEKEILSDSLEYSKKSKKLIGVPTNSQLHNLKPVIKNEPPLPDNIPQDFRKITINPLKFRIYSHNIKNGGNHILVPGEQEWSERYRPLTASINFHSTVPNTIITLQEVYKYQMLDIMKELNRYSEEWSYYGAGRIDGEDTGEFVGIIYRKKEWELVYSDTMWLNHKNPRMSIEGWDATYLRIVSYVTLKHKETNNYINIFNTHFDHLGLNSQLGSANLILERMAQINQWPSFLVGDLNSEPKHDAYQLIRQHMVDSTRLTTPFNKYAHSRSTVTGFEGEVLVEGGQNIDYIFAPKYTRKIDSEVKCDSLNANSPNNKIDLRLTGYGMLHSKFDGVYISDHRPIVADFSMSGKC